VASYTVLLKVVSLSYAVFRRLGTIMYLMVLWYSTDFTFNSWAGKCVSQRDFYQYVRVGLGTAQGFVVICKDDTGASDLVNLALNCGHSRTFEETRYGILHFA
jgi:hypothetical protein